MDTCCRYLTAVVLLFLLCIFCSLPSFCYASDILTQGQSIRDGETLNSSGLHFALGFFSPENSTSRYVGIWYNKIEEQTVVWVANRDSPIGSTDGVFRLDETGNLLVLDGNISIWSSNASASSSNLTAILLDTGNLVLSSSGNVGDTETALWQSFNSSTDTFLPGMKALADETVGETRLVTSWKTETDPSTGNYSMGVDPRAAPQIVIWDGSERYWRSGHWNGLIFTGVPDMMAVYLYGFKLTTGEKDGLSYFTYTPSNSSDILRFQIRWDGNEEQLIWDSDNKEWSVMQLQPQNECDEYNRCGDFGICSFSDSASCSCLEGFQPRNVGEWNRGNWSGGCERRTPLMCERNTSANGTGEGDGFLKVEGVKLPDFADRVDVESDEECEKQCLQNCSCMSYAYVTGIGCMMWGGDLVDIRHFSGGKTTLHLRLADSELGKLFLKLSIRSLLFFVKSF